MKKKPVVQKLTPFEELKEYISDYINLMEDVNHDRMFHAEKELSNVMKECQAFNMLQKNINGLNLSIITNAAS